MSPHHIRTTVEYTPLQRDLATCCVCRVQEVSCNPPWRHEIFKEEFPSGEQNVPCQVVGILEIVILEWFLESWQCFLQFLCPSQELKGGGGRWGVRRGRGGTDKDGKRRRRGQVWCCGPIASSVLDAEWARAFGLRSQRPAWVIVTPVWKERGSGRGRGTGEGEEEERKHCAMHTTKPEYGAEMRPSDL